MREHLQTNRHPSEMLQKLIIWAYDLNRCPHILENGHITSPVMDKHS
jgi:hypothetical protein